MCYPPSPLIRWWGIARKNTIMLDKDVSHAFGKNTYLLGEDSTGTKYWLEAPTWDCSWYWGFGYVETYRNNHRPSSAADIDSHQHANGEYIAPNAAGTDHTYNNDANLFTGDFLVSKTFNEADGWTLRELFAQFYHLQEQAAFYGRGHMNISSLETRHALQDKKQAKKINTVYIPMVMKNILQLLSTTTKTVTDYIQVIDDQTAKAKNDLNKKGDV